MNFLIIRFRQMGDTVLVTPLLSTLRQNYPDARIDIVLNENLRPLLEHHPAVSNIITFTPEERHSLPLYLRKVWRVVHAVSYDAIFDLRSTINTLPFALFSPATKLRVGMEKPYARWVHNRHVPNRRGEEHMIDHNLNFLRPLGIKNFTRTLSLATTPQEDALFRQYMQEQGIDFSRPVVLASVTSKLSDKTWGKERWTELLRRFMQRYADAQVVLNIVPGKEAEEARQVHEALGSGRCFVNVEARGIRPLMSMSKLVTLYIGNEGGTRHIVDAMGRPTFSICSPQADKNIWIPASERHCAVSPADYLPAAELQAMDYQAQYGVMDVDRVWTRLCTFLDSSGCLTERPGQQ